MKEYALGRKRIVLKQGDITEERVCAIVNAANSRLAGGGGVDGAIHRAGGPSIMAECDRIRSGSGGCPAGRAVITGAGDLDADYVVHAVGPVWHGGERGEAELLAGCYSNSLRLASEKGCRTIAFPSISTGAYRYPVAEAATTALKTVIESLEEIDMDEVRFILFSKADLDVYTKTLDSIIAEDSGWRRCSS